MESSLTALGIRKPNMELETEFSAEILQIKPGKPFSILVQPFEWVKTYNDIETYLNNEYSIGGGLECLYPEDVKGQSSISCILFEPGYGAVRGVFTGEVLSDSDGQEHFTIKLIDCGCETSAKLDDDDFVLYLGEKVIEKIPPLIFECHLVGLEAYYEKPLFSMFARGQLKWKNCKVKIVEKITDSKAYVTMKLIGTGEDVTKMLINKYGL